MINKVMYRINHKESPSLSVANFFYELKLSAFGKLFLFSMKNF